MCLSRVITVSYCGTLTRMDAGETTSYLCTLGYNSTTPTTNASSYGDIKELNDCTTTLMVGLTGQVGCIDTVHMGVMGSHFLDSPYPVPLMETRSPTLLVR